MRLPSVGLAPQHPWAVLPFEPSIWRVVQESVATQLRPAAELGRLHDLEASRKNRRRSTAGLRVDVAALEELVLSHRAFICEVVAPHRAATFAVPCDEIVFRRASPSLRAVVPGDRPSDRRDWVTRQNVLGMWCVCNEGDSEDGGGGGDSGGGGADRGSVVRGNAVRRQGSARLGLAGARHGKARAPLVAMVAIPARAATAARAAVGLWRRRAFECRC